MTPIINTDKVLRPRDPVDHYPTPYGLCVAALQAYADGWAPERACDPGAGSGPWGRAVRAFYAPQTTEITGIDLYAAEPPGVYDVWARADYLTWDGGPFGLICGNPPYRDAEAFVRRAYAQLVPGGTLIFLLRLAFLESVGRGRGLWRDLPPNDVGVCVGRPSFTGDGRTDATAYAVYRWVRGAPPLTTRLEWLDWTASAGEVAA
jgi:hypothetical protein